MATKAARPRAAPPAHRPAPRPPAHAPLRRQVRAPAARPPRRPAPIAHEAAYSGSHAQLALWARQNRAAADYAHIPRWVLWGVFGMETNFGRYIDTSSADAMGLMQFIPSTAGQWNYPMTNRPNVAQSQQQFTAAALYLRSLRRQFGSWNQALIHYSGGGYDDAMVQQKAGTLNQSQFAGPAPALTERPTYVNPLARAKVRAERIDQGVDYAGTGELVAIADGVITEWAPNGWAPYGNYLEYKCETEGQLHGVSFYYAEGIEALVRVGQRVTAGEPIARLIPGWHSGIEIGVAAGNGSMESWARAYGGGYSEGEATRAGIWMSRLIKQLGGPPGVQEGQAGGSWPSFAPGGDVSSTVLPGPSASNPAFYGYSAPAAADYARQFDWSGTLLNNWWQIGHGGFTGRHHSHAAVAYALGIHHLTNKPRR